MNGYGCADGEYKTGFHGNKLQNKTSAYNCTPRSETRNGTTIIGTDA
jgi:hypothetical protein